MGIKLRKPPRSSHRRWLIGSAVALAGLGVGLRGLHAVGTVSSTVINPLPDLRASGGLITTYDVGVDNGRVRIRGTATASDGATLAGVNVYLNGAAAPTFVPVAPHGGPFQLFLDSAALGLPIEPATNTVVVRAVNTDGTIQAGGVTRTFQVRNGLSQGRPVASFEIGKVAGTTPFDTGQGEEANPANYAFTNSRNIRLQGTAIAPAGQTISFLRAGNISPTTDAPLTVSEDFNLLIPGANSSLYDTPFTLTAGDGLKAVRLEAVTNVGTSTAQYKRAIVLDTTAPSATLSTPVAGSISGTRTLTFTGTLSDALSGVASATLTLERLNPADGNFAAVTSGTVDIETGSGTTKTFSETFTVDRDGTYRTRVSVSDYATNVFTTANSVFSVDTAAPVVNITAPAEGACVREPATLTFTVTDQSSGTFQVLRNGVLVTNGNFTGGTTGMFNVSVPAPDGTNTYTVRATDTSNPALTTTVTRTVVSDNVAPTATLTTPTEGQVRSGVVEVRGTVTDNRNLARYEVLLDGAVVNTANVSGTTAPLSFLLNTPTLSAGNHTLVLRATDECGNVTSSASRSFVVDNTAPVITITSPGAAACLENPVQIRATVTDTTAVSWTLLVDGVQTDTGTGSNISVDRTLAEGVHTLEIRAVDAATLTGNASVATRSFTVDLAAPTAVIDQPTAGQKVAPGTVDVRGSVADSLQLGSYELFLNPADPANPQPAARVAQATVTGTSALVRATVDLTGASGNQTLVLRATDACGRTGLTSVTIDVDPDVPVASITEPSEGQVVTGVITVRGTASDPDGLSSYELLLDGELLTQANVTGTNATITRTVNTGNLGDGTHTLVLRVTDLVGNVGTDTVSFVVDNTAPSVAITAPAAGACLPRQFRVQGTVADTAATISQIQILANGSVATTATVTPVNDPANPTVRARFDEQISISSDGPVTLMVRATDPSGNVGTSSAVNVTVDGTAPSRAELVRPADNSLFNTNFTVEGIVEDAVGLASYEVRAGNPAGESRSLTGVVSASGTATSVVQTIQVGAASNQLDNGQHTLFLRVTDECGNVTNGATRTVRIDTVAPTVTFVTPSEDDKPRHRTRARTGSTLPITFEITDPTNQGGLSLRGLVVTVRTDEGKLLKRFNAVALRIPQTTPEANRTVTVNLLIASGTFRPNEVYRVSVSGVQDAAGNRTPLKRTSFQVVVR